MYADDTIILAESPDELQIALNAVHEYCNTWHLTVNASKTKIVIFSRGKIRKTPHFTYVHESVDVVHDCLYLGVQFDYNGTFKKQFQGRLRRPGKLYTVC